MLSPNRSLVFRHSAYRSWESALFGFSSIARLNSRSAVGQSQSAKNTAYASAACASASVSSSSSACPCFPPPSFFGWLHLVCQCHLERSRLVAPHADGGESPPQCDEGSKYPVLPPNGTHGAFVLSAVGEETSRAAEGLATHG